VLRSHNIVKIAKLYTPLCVRPFQSTSINLMQDGGLK
jgi:hypothetical protein